ncbi:Hsp20/alpha crystallin family protein [Halostella sp. JP-L12]|nr:Hsp20/alpha crystallin family protein [Halostella sp. JP-L12]
MDRMMEQMRTMWGREGWSDATSLVEEDGEYVFVMDLPGFEREEISLTFDDGVLTVTADRETESETVARRRRVDERVTVPGEVDVDAVAATYRNGVLEVRLPTTDAADRGRRIEIEE